MGWDGMDGGEAVVNRGLRVAHDPVRNGRRGGMDALALAPGTRYAREGRFAGDGPRDPALGCFRGRGIYLAVHECAVSCMQGGAAATTHTTSSINTTRSHREVSQNLTTACAPYKLYPDLAPQIFNYFPPYPGLYFIKSPSQLSC